MRSGKAIAATLLALAGAAALLLAQLPSDPVCQGRPASAWARELFQNDRESRQRAEDIFRELKARGVPRLRSMLRARAWPWENGWLASIFPFLRRRGADPAVQRERGAEVAALLGPEAAEAAPELVACLAYPENARSAERALSRIGPAVVPELIRGLAAGSSEVRARSARLLRDYAAGHPECAGPLMRTLRDPESRVRCEAAEALGELQRKDNSTLSSLLSLQDDPSAEVRSAMFGALGKGGSAAPRIRAALARGVNDAVPMVRLEAAKAYWALTGEPKTPVETLIGVLPTAEGWQAAYALGNIGPPAAAAVPALIAALQREKVPRAFRTPPSSCFALGQIREAAIPALEEVLDSSQLEIRVAAVLAFGFMGEHAAKAIPKLERLLKDEDAEVRHVTAITLAGAGAKREVVLPALAECLQAEDIYMRSTAAALLRQIAPEQEWTAGPE